MNVDPRTSVALVPSKVLTHHRDRLAIVYVRQSTLKQVEQNQESTRMQYNLVEVGRRYGWPQERIVVIDDDLGISGASAEGRPGFQRLLREVALDRIGLVLGIEMSRLSRSCRDWHQLLELCARYATLIGDLDGLYDPTRYNDRLLLGLKGTMSEAELHVLRQRLFEGKLEKARRGELGKRVPAGYMVTPAGEVQLDPDEAVRKVIGLVFHEFARIGTVHGLVRYLHLNDIRIGGRRQVGLDRGDLAWRRPYTNLLGDMLRNPIYAGAYVYGRRGSDPRRQRPGRPASGRTGLVAPEQWRAFVKDALPAYITWKQYEENQRRLAQNRERFAHTGRGGTALLQGLITCGRCGRTMLVQYASRNGRRWLRYVCMQEHSQYGGEKCQGLSGKGLDDVVTGLAFAALEPSALAVSLELARDVAGERARLDDIWQDRMQRARYETERARRQFDAVEPENRLVARTLESMWNERIAQQQKLEVEYRRFVEEQPRTLSAADIDRIRAAAANIPGLWAAPTTTNEDRREILGLLIQKVVVTVAGNSEDVDVVVHWAGTHETAVHVRRPVGKLFQLSGHQEILERIVQLRVDGCTGARVAELLNEDGWTTPHGGSFNERLVRSFVERYGLPAMQQRGHIIDGLKDDEMRIEDAAEDLGVPRPTVYGWLRRGLLKARRHSSRGPWLIHLDDAERKRLLELRRRRNSRGRRG